MVVYIHVKCTQSFLRPGDRCTVRDMGADCPENIFIGLPLVPCFVQRRRPSYSFTRNNMFARTCSGTCNVRVNIYFRTSKAFNLSASGQSKVTSHDASVIHRKMAASMLLQLRSSILRLESRVFTALGLNNTGELGG